MENNTAIGIGGVETPKGWNDYRKD